MKALVALLMPFVLIGQPNCSPYHKVRNYEVSNDVMYSIAYISCFHARGVTIEMGTKDVQIGTTIMGHHHKNAAYIFTHYNKDIKAFRFYGGLIARINNDPAMGMFRVGVDAKLYERLYFTTSLSQLNPLLGYANFGFKLIM